MGTKTFVELKTQILMLEARESYLAIQHKNKVMDKYHTCIQRLKDLLNRKEKEGVLKTFKVTRKVVVNEYHVVEVEAKDRGDAVKKAMMVELDETTVMDEGDIESDDMYKLEEKE